MSNQEQTQRDRDLTEALRSGRTARGGAKLLSVLGGVLVILGVIAGGALPLLIAGAALLALGCHLCRTCQTGRCAWGIATQRPELVQRLDPDVGAERLVNLVTAWKHEIKEMMGGMGINSIEALRGNRVMLRGIHLTDKELARKIRQVDAARAKTQEMISDFKWGDKKWYHLCVNTSGLPIPETAALVAEYAKHWFERKERYQ